MASSRRQPSRFLFIASLALLHEGARAVPRHSKFKVSKTGEIELAAHPQLRINVQGGHMSEGDPLVLWPCSAQNHELFDFVDGVIKLRANPSLCLNAEAGPNVGAKIVTWPCAHRGVYEGHEGFTFGKDGRIRLTEHPDKCINVKEGRLAASSEVVLWKCETDDNHMHDRFTYQDGVIRLMARRDLHLNVQGGDLVNSAPVIVWSCNPGLHEVFEFVYPENRIRLKHKPEMCVNAEGGLTLGARLVIWPCHAVPAPHEKFVYDTERQVIHPQMVSTVSWNVKGGNMQNGGEIILWLTDEKEEL